ncbi:MAG TPA: hypothetical protein VEQ58_02205 [Polyangiaceae bacterium]|nr:hypothetical protein [Polyangiaceae bacterium]
MTCATTSLAQPSPTALPEEAVRLQFTAPPGCPDAASFVAQVRARTARGRIAEPAELARTFNVVVAADERGFNGTIEFLDESGASVSRRVPGEQCDAVVSSLALITALALDATLRTDEAEPAAPPVEPAPALPPPPAPPAPIASQPFRVKQSSLESARLGLLASYGSALGAARFGLLGQLDWRRGFSLRLTAHYASREVTVDGGRSAKLRSPGLEASVCPARLRARTLVLTACATLDVGWLRASGVQSEQLASVSADTIWWAAAGARFGAAWEPRSPFWLELFAAAEFPLRAGYQFRFENPRVVAYEVPYFGGSAALAAGVRFW